MHYRAAALLHGGLILLALARAVRAAAVQSLAARKCLSFMGLSTSPMREWYFHQDGSSVVDYLDQLVFACECGFDDAVAEAVASGLVGVNDRDGALLRAACAADRTDLATFLLAHGADAAVVSNEPLISAVERGNARLLGRLIRAGADADAREGLPLAMAASSGRVRLVWSLICMGASPRASFDNALVAAATGGHLEVVRLLLRIGGNARARNYEALIKAAAGGHAGIIELLLAAGCGANRSALKRAAVEALIGAHLALAKSLLDQSREGWGGPLLEAASRGRLKEVPLEMVQNLLMNDDALQPGDYHLFFERAISEGRRDLVERITATAPVDSLDVAAGIACAVACRDAGLVRLLMQKYDHALSRTDVNLLLAKAMEADSAELETYLVDERGAVLAEEAMAGLISALAGSGNVERMLHFLPQGMLGTTHAQEALPSAMEGGRLEAVDGLLARGAHFELNRIDEYVLGAVKGGHAQLLALLLTTFPDYPVVGAVSVAYAAANDSMEMLGLLERANVPARPHSEMALVAAAERGSMAVLRHLVAISGGTIAEDSGVFMAAVVSQQAEVVRFLFSHDGGRHAARIEGLLRISLACLGEEPGDADFLLGLSTDVAAIDCRQMFLDAARKGAVELMREILPYVSEADRLCITEEMLSTTGAFSQEALDALADYAALLPGDG